MGEINRVAVVGGGTMGNGIAHVFAQYGFDVLLVDVSQERVDHAVRTITSNLDRQVKKGTIDQAARDATVTRIEAATDLPQLPGRSWWSKPCPSGSI